MVPGEVAPKCSTQRGCVMRKRKRITPPTRKKSRTCVFRFILFCTQVLVEVDAYSEGNLSNLENKDSA